MRQKKHKTNVSPTKWHKNESKDKHQNSQVSVVDFLCHKICRGLGGDERCERMYEKKHNFITNGQ